MEFVFLFTLLAGLAVLYAAIVSTQDERIHEAAIFAPWEPSAAARARLGSRIRHIGRLAGLFARRAPSAGLCRRRICVESELYIQSLDMGDWFFAGMAGVTAAGLMGTRSALSTPPLHDIA